MVQGVHVGLFQPVFRNSSLPVWLQLMGAVGGLGHAPACLGGFLQFVGALNAHVVVLVLSNFPVSRRQNRVSRCVPDRMGQLGRRLFLDGFLKF